MNRSGWSLWLSLAMLLAAPASLRAQKDYVPDAHASPDTLGPTRWGFSVTPYIWSAGQKGRLGLPPFASAGLHARLLSPI